MRVRISFEVDVDKEGFKRYLAEYPNWLNMASEARQPVIETVLEHEALTAWEYEGIITGFGEAHSFEFLEEAPAL